MTTFTMALASGVIVEAQYVVKGRMLHVTYEGRKRSIQIGSSPADANYLDWLAQQALRGILASMTGSAA